MSTHRTDLLAVAREHAAEPNRWIHRLRFDPAARWFDRLARTDDAEVWLLSWLPGQSTDLHDHGGSSGAFTVVAGELTEERLTGGPRLRTNVLRAGRGHRFGPQYIHRVRNAGTLPAVSVHAYSPALASMTRYELTDSGLSVAAVDLAGATW